MKIKNKSTFKKDLGEFTESIKNFANYHDGNMVKNILSKDTVFATFAMFAEVNGVIKEKYRESFGGRISNTSYEGLDENSMKAGYLSHNGTRLRFQTDEDTIFDEPFTNIDIKEHSLGIMAKTSNKTYMFGQFTPINETLTPNTKFKGGFGDAIIWTRELAKVRAIDKNEWRKSQKKRLIFLVLWFTGIGLLTLLLALVS